MDEPTHDDASLVVRCRQGDAAAWTALVRRYQPLVHAIVLRAGLDAHAAADVLQIVFAQLLQQLPRLNQPERLRAWIVTTAKRQALLARRIGLRTVSLSPASAALDGDEGPDWADQLADEAPLAEQVLSDLQQSDLLRRALEGLDTRCRDLLLLLYGDEDERLSYDQVAQQLTMPVGSIGPTRARCILKLRQLFDQFEQLAA
jgi:RNA polymerase sigma factor (sigma-70 family)